eukprot:g1381.t1
MRARAGSGEHHGIKTAGKRTEEALKEVGDSMNEVFKDMKEQWSKFTRPSWFGGSSKEAHHPVRPGSSKEPTEVHAHPEDDATMRHHCAALERLVEMGLSPQAAKVAASSAGEPILHVHDQVRLEGLVKNKGTNGALGILQAYGAESHRWKVTLHDGQDGFLVWQLECQCQKSTVCVQAVISDCFPIPSPPFGQTKTHQPPFLSEVFWIKPKLLKPLQLRRMPLPDPSPPEDTTHADEEFESPADFFPPCKAALRLPCQAMLGFLQSIGAFDALPTIDNSPQRTPGTLQVALPFCGSMQELLVITDFLAKQLDLSAVQHPPASLVFAIHPECTVQRELWKKILSNVISATVGLCVVATFSEDEAKVVASIGQALQRRCQVHQNPYYEGASPPSGPSGPPSGPGGCYPNPPFMKYIVTVTR